MFSSNNSTIDEIHVNGEVLVSSVVMANSFRKRFRGLMLEEELKPGEGMIFTFSRTSYRGIHTFAVKFPIDVVWVNKGVVTCVKTMKPWVDLWIGKADLIIELPAGAASEVEIGDEITY